MIIPVYDSNGMLEKCLEALAASTVEPHECIVVDDCSEEAPDDLVTGRAVKLIRQEQRRGPAAARNHGAREATGDVLLFLDADVCVHPDTIERIVDAFALDPDLDGLFGSYDDAPGAPDFLSQYRNLMHAFVHQHAKSEASTFWSGCGAIRKKVFLDEGGFDESFTRATLEDVELGHRLYRSGRKITLDRDIRVTHLKRWTFWGIVKTDIFGRGIPWTELILRDRHMPNDLNIGISQRISVALAFLLVGMSLFAALWWQGQFLVPLFAVLFFVLGRYWGEFAVGRDRKMGLVLTTTLVGTIVLAAWAHDQSVLIPPLLLGYIILLVRHRYEYDTHTLTYLLGLAAVVTVALATFKLFYLPYHRFVFAVILVAFVLVLVNTQFYLFLASKRGRLFAIAAIPFHLLYHFYNGVSFIAGTCRYFLLTGRKTRRGAVIGSRVQPKAKAGH